MNNLGRFIALSLLLVLANPVLADISAYLNQNTFYEGDPITLYLENTMRTKASPDLSALENDFSVLGTSSNSQINIFNGKQTFKQTWSVELLAKHKGIAKIPAISIGNETTQALNIKIVALPAEVKEETSKHIFIETSVGISGKETYVQQQIPYMVKFYFDSSMQSGEINQPSVENAVVEKLGEDKRYKVRRGGKRFSVVEKHFTISPEKSGTLHIPATKVSGRITLSSKNKAQLRQNMDDTGALNKFLSNFRNDPFFNDPFFQDSLNDGFLNRRQNLGLSQPFTIESKTLDVNVLPVPKSFTGSAWLPAEELTIRDSWTHSAPELKVGEPVTRSLTLRAKGLGGSQIPTTVIPKPVGVKIYPEKPISKTHTDGITLIGRQYFDISYIPQKAGKITIPAINVDWWNIKTKKQETYTLPAWHLNVTPGTLANKEATTGDSSITNNIENQNKTIQAETAQAKTAKEDSPIDITSSSWNWKIPAILLSLLLAIGGLLYAIKKYRNNPNKNAQKQTKANINNLKNDVFQACTNNNKQLAAKSILKLAQAQWDDSSIQSLGALISQLENGTKTIKELETSLYAPKSDSWNGTELKSLIEKIGLQQKQSTQSITEGVLAPLYPT